MTTRLVMASLIACQAPFFTAGVLESASDATCATVLVAAATAILFWSFVLTTRGLRVLSKH